MKLRTRKSSVNFGLPNEYIFYQIDIKSNIFAIVATDNNLIHVSLSSILFLKCHTR